MGLCGIFGTWFLVSFDCLDGETDGEFERDYKGKELASDEVVPICMGIASK